MRYAATLRRAMTESIEAKQRFLQHPTRLEVFERAVARVIKAYRNGGRLYIAGNGGSAADAQHLATELVCRLGRERGPLPAEAMTVDTSALTAIANDYGFQHVFERQVWAKMRPEDVFLAISTSGNSHNILLALEACRARGIASLLFAGRDGGAAAGLADFTLLAEGRETGTIQESHIVFAHALCACLEDELLPADAAGPR
jgi:D-sedoheptulose 7-phosphate isomerase